MSLELSLCLIVKDEEPYLRRCVESFGAIYDELVIVDTGSTDRTTDIARELLAHREGRLEHFTWCDDFAAARNHACSFARAPWILMVDADERLSPDLSPRVILEAIRRAPPQVLNLLLADLTLHEGEIILSHPVNRLFRRDPRVRWTGRIHESLTVTAEQQILTQITLVHDNARKRQADARLRPEVSAMYERGLLADAEATPESPRPLFYLGNTLAERKQWAAAIEAYHRWLAFVGKRGWKEEVWQAHLNIALCSSHLGDTEGCRRALLDAVAVDPTRGEAHLALGDRALAVGDLAEARTWYQFAATLPPPRSSIFVDLHAYRVKPWWKLGTVLVEQGDHAGALTATEHALELSPGDPAIVERAEALRLTLRAQQAPPTIVIPSRDPALARRCLRGIAEQEGPLFFEVVLVCDGGTAPFEPLMAEFRGLRLVAGRRPFVFARNANLGIAACEGDVVLLNDDAIPGTPGWLDVLHRAAHARPDAGPVSPLLSQSGNPAQDVRVAVAARAGADPRHASDPAFVAEASFVTFVCAYLRRALLDRVGPLDTGFVWYGWEDNDYCLRARQAGLPSLVAHGALVSHDSPSSSFRSPDQGRLMQQARSYFERKHLALAAACDVLVRVHGERPREPERVAMVLRAAPAGCRVLVLATEIDDALARELCSIHDPRLQLRFLDPAPEPGAVLDELAGGRAELVVEVTPEGRLPRGTIEGLLEARLGGSPELGVLAVPRPDHAPSPDRPTSRCGTLRLVPVEPDDPALAHAAVYAVARLGLERFGPLAGGASEPSPWQRLALRMARHGTRSALLPVPLDPRGPS
jgi:GT2 family glycosyltransferase/tetratricopeptide (TPR) repeat protein